MPCSLCSVLLAETQDQPLKPLACIAVELDCLREDGAAERLRLSLRASTSKAAVLDEPLPPLTGPEGLQI